MKWLLKALGVDDGRITTIWLPRWSGLMELLVMPDAPTVASAEDVGNAALVGFECDACGA